MSVALGRTEQIIRNTATGEHRARRAWLAYQAHALPHLDGAAALTSAKIDLLPHQVVIYSPDRHIGPTPLLDR